jgi:hypothetical protein
LFQSITKKSVALHLFWIRDLIGKQIIGSITWCGTPDMTADGHTKGSVSRDALLDLMSGKFEYRHAVQISGCSKQHQTKQRTPD